MMFLDPFLGAGKTIVEGGPSLLRPFCGSLRLVTETGMAVAYSMPEAARPKPIERERGGCSSCTVSGAFLLLGQFLRVQRSNFKVNLQET